MSRSRHHGCQCSMCASFQAQRAVMREARAPSVEESEAGEVHAYELHDAEPCDCATEYGCVCGAYPAPKPLRVPLSQLLKAS